jgi:hypothetical protein
VVATCGMGVVEVIGEMAKSIEYGHVCSHVNGLFNTTLLNMTTDKVRSTASERGRMSVVQRASSLRS